ncbi:MAG TPA: SulP family inorganic anion transporter, partial [Luteolibacter sp.]|nr:SulP family inorganic anion transporter [Luteolibacter sp.]
RMFAGKHKYRLDSNQEFLALAGANLAAGVGQGFPVSGGMSQSLVNESGGAKTPLSGFIASLLILLVILFLSGLLRHLPQPVLAAIVLAAVTSLFKVSALRHIWRFNRGEFAVAIAALLGVLGSGLLTGVLIGAVLSILLLLRRAKTPPTTELGRVPGTEYFADRIRHPENQSIPGVFIFRCSGGLLYFNTAHVRDRFFELLARREDPIHTAVFFLGTVPAVDMAGVELIAELHATLRERGIDLRLAEAHSGVRDSLRRAGFEKFYGPIVPDQTVDAVLDKSTNHTTTPIPMNRKLIRPLKLAPLLLAAGLLASCTGHVDRPQGTSKGYASARLIQRNPNLPAPSSTIEKQVHGLIQKSLAGQFASKGMSYGKGDSDLVVAYLVIYQEPGMTADYRDYFGYGRNADDIAVLAHNRGALGDQPDFFRQAGIVIDVIDSRTNKLVYRGFSKNDVVKGASSSTRAARIDAAVAEALADFFR